MYGQRWSRHFRQTWAGRRANGRTSSSALQGKVGKTHAHLQALEAEGTTDDGMTVQRFAGRESAKRRLGWND